MAAARIRERTRSARTFSFSRNNEDENVYLNANKDATENAYDILCGICKKQGVSDGRRVALLNLLIKLMEDVTTAKLPLALTKRELFCCLRVGLVSSNTAVRAATHRALRYFVREPSDVSILNKLQVPHLIARSIDIVLKNDLERIQAMRLSLKMLNCSPRHFSTAVTRSLVSLVNGVSENKDRMSYTALFLLCQLCVLNADTAIECAGETCILRCCIEMAQGRINECLVGCLMFLLNKPETRNRAHLNIDYLTSVYCDLQRKRNEANLFASSRLSILAAIRSWPGVFHLCNPDNSSAMKAVISVLYINDQQLRKAIVDLFCEMFGIEEGDWSQSVETAAMMTVDPHHPRDSWRLSEKFIVAEGRDILPHRADARPNLTEVHTALLLYSFLECGLLSALVEVAIHGDSCLSNQAIVLLGYLLYLSHKLLPSELLDVSPSLPSLVSYITQGEPGQRVRAIMTMSALHTTHNLLTKSLTPHSLFLRHYLSQGPLSKKKEPGKTIGCGDGKGSNQLSIKNVDVHVRESKVLVYPDPRDWSWSEISTIIKCRQESFLRLEDVQHRAVLRKLTHFFKPSSSQFSALEYSYKDPRNAIYAAIALDFLDLLLDFPTNSDGEKMLEELVGGVVAEVGRVAGPGTAHDCLLSPSKVSGTVSRHYFLMLGHLTRSLRGIAVLESLNAFPTLLHVVDTTAHDVFVKLIVSSLCYTHSTMARKILTRALSSPMNSVRVYSTEMLLVLARCQVPAFHTWGLDLLLPQIYDHNKLVADTSIDILHELSYDAGILDCLIDTRPSLLHLGDKGQLLLIRFLSTPHGFAALNEANFIEKELEKWEKGYNYRYVGLVESLVHDAVTLHQREDNGKYSRRLTNARHQWKPVWVPPHLYGQLAGHAAGMALLEASPCLQRMQQKIYNGSCDSDLEVLELKASVWAMGNIGTTVAGLLYLQDRHIVQGIVTLAQTCPVLPVRATAFYCLSLIATTEEGASALAQMDWLALRRCRSARWPIEAETPDRLSRHDDDVTSSSLAFSVEEADSVEDLSSFLEPTLTKNSHLFPAVKRASTLPPGLSGDLDEVDLCKSPLRFGMARHQRSRSETCSLHLRHGLDQSPPATPQRLSMEDAAGIATLQTLHAARRPDLTSNSNSIFPLQTRRLIDNCPASPMTDFDAENPIRLFADIPSGEADDAAASTARKGGGAAEIDASAIATVYCGICLPRSLSQLFTMTDRREEKRRKRGSVSFSEMEQVKEEEKAESSGCSDSSDGAREGERWNRDVTGVPEQNARSANKSRHNGAHCLSCCTKAPKKRQRKVSTSSFRLRTDTESSYGNAPDGSPISLKWRLKATSEGGSGESFSCGEADCDVTTTTTRAPPPVIHSVTRVRRDVLKHVGRMCNPVWAKASRQSLLQLRQSHQSVFQDVCLYSDVCANLSNSACRVSARRFIQELFLDLTFSQYFDDADQILAAIAPDPTPPQPTPPLSLKDEPTTSSSPTAVSPTKNLSTVFENLSSCGTQSLQGSRIASKDTAPKT